MTRSKEQDRLYKREEYKRNPEKFRERSRRNRANNPEYTKTQNQKYWAEHREELKLYSLKYREENSSYIHSRQKAYKEKLKDACPKLVSGSYSPAEDSLILKWTGRIEDLARALGRSYDSTVTRKRRLLGLK